ncbi:uncharacterized protein TNCV_1485751 [Trichonephila clavipes]|nr:uncharacterized protein TNCV_1485751 [Trichonephila clavipes]
MLLSIIFITSGKNSGDRLRKSGQTVGRLRKTCQKAVPGTIPFSFGRVDTSIATESVLNVHFKIYALVVNHEQHVEVVFKTVENHLVMLAWNFKKYFLAEDNLIASYEWVRDSFHNTSEGLSTAEEEIFIDFTSSV